MPAAAGAITGVIRNASYTISTYEFQTVLRKCRLVPSAETVTYETSVPEGMIVDVGTPSWVLEIQGVQDHAEALGLARLLTEHHGEELDCILVPRNEDGYREATFVAIAMAVPFGDEVGKMADFEVTLPVMGQPTWDDVEPAP